MSLYCTILWFYDFEQCVTNFTLNAHLFTWNLYNLKSFQYISVIFPCQTYNLIYEYARMAFFINSSRIISPKIKGMEWNSTYYLARMRLFGFAISHVHANDKRGSHSESCPHSRSLKLLVKTKMKDRNPFRQISNQKRNKQILHEFS